MYAMFDGAHKFNQDITGWDVSKVTNMQSLFNNAKAFNQDISVWSTAVADTMGYMFKDAESFNVDISNWDVSNVLFMNGMFNGALQFNQDLSAWKEHNFPYTAATDIFKDSGCEVETTPESEDNTFCARKYCLTKVSLLLALLIKSSYIICYHSRHYVMASSTYTYFHAACQCHSQLGPHVRVTQH